MTTYQYQITIDGSVIGQAVGAGVGDGFIDPTTMEEYRTNVLLTGSTFGTIAIGQTVFINDVEVTMSGTTVSDVISDINALTSTHRVVASQNAGKLTLIKQTGFSLPLVSVTDGTDGITAELGFVSPVATVVDLPTTVERSLAKKRGNWRWKAFIQKASKQCNIDSIDSITLTGIDTTFASNPSEIDVTLSYREEYYSDNGTGTTALKADMVELLMTSFEVTDVYYDPSNTTPNPPPIKPRTYTAQRIVVGELTTSSVDATAAVTVTAL